MAILGAGYKKKAAVTSLRHLAHIDRHYLQNRGENQMPIYEFKCKKCNRVFESLCFKSDGSDRGPCPQCGADDSEKQMSTFSSVNSGSGMGLDAGASSCAPHGGFS
ncbi:MAG: FmdB family zinc ribbon protein [Desulfobacteraceae bacterium]